MSSQLDESVQAMPKKDTLIHGLASACDINNAD